MTEQTAPQLDQLIPCYLNLESLEGIEELLDVCGATLDERALPMLERRLQEEESSVLHLTKHGYIRMREKSEQLIASIKPLIKALEKMNHDTQR
ncbi:hypothetical protein ccbrp13_14550 [Ktedonobacteria bacterium brp13]|nr:hypothetical protein ccbrp13_14550 [Ktedonobacteria bacterium brp13]